MGSVQGTVGTAQSHSLAFLGSDIRHQPFCVLIPVSSFMFQDTIENSHKYYILLRVSKDTPQFKANQTITGTKFHNMRKIVFTNRPTTLKVRGLSMLCKLPT